MIEANTSIELFLQHLKVFKNKDNFLFFLNKIQDADIFWQKNHYKTIISQAARLNDEEVLSIIFERYPQFLDQETCIIICKEAARNNNKMIFDTYSKSTELTEYHFIGQAIIEASSQNNVELVRKLVADHDLSHLDKEDRENILVNIVELNNCADLLKSLLQTNIDPLTIRSSYFYSIAYGQFEYVSILINSVQNRDWLFEATIDGIDMLIYRLNDEASDPEKIEFLLKVNKLPLITFNEWFNCLNINLSNDKLLNQLICLSIMCGQFKLTKNLINKYKFKINLILIEKAINNYCQIQITYLLAKKDDHRILFIQDFRELIGYLKRMLQVDTLNADYNLTLLYYFSASANLDDLKTYFENTFFNKSPFNFNQIDTHIAILIALINKREENANYLIDQYWYRYDVSYLHTRIVNYAVENNTSIRHLFMNYRKQLLSLDTTAHDWIGRMLDSKLSIGTKFMLFIKGKQETVLNASLDEMNKNHKNEIRNIESKLMHWDELFKIAKLTLNKDNLKIIEEFMKEIPNPVAQTPEVSTNRITFNAAF
jgi:hypothetical protein